MNSVVPTKLITENKDIIKDGSKEVFTCSSDTSNPVSTIKWKMVTGGGSNDLTHKATAKEEGGVHKGHEVTSSLTLTVTKEMNEHKLTCELWYKSSLEKSHTYDLRVSCELTNKGTISLSINCTIQKGTYFLILLYFKNNHNINLLLFSCQRHNRFFP